MLDLCERYTAFNFNCQHMVSHPPSIREIEFGLVIASAIADIVIFTNILGSVRQNNMICNFWFQLLEQCLWLQAHAVHSITLNNQG